MRVRVAFLSTPTVSFALKKLIRISFQSATAAGTGAHVPPYRFYGGGRAREERTFMLSKRELFAQVSLYEKKKRAVPAKVCHELRPFNRMSRLRE